MLGTKETIKHSPCSSAADRLDEEMGHKYVRVLNNRKIEANKSKLKTLCG